jgi:hypothetical protein
MMPDPGPVEAAEAGTNASNTKTDPEPGEPAPSSPSVASTELPAPLAIVHDTPADTRVTTTMPLGAAISVEFVHELAKLHEQVQAGSAGVHFTPAAIAFSAGGLTVAYVAIAARAGMLSATMLPGISLWQALDPSTFLNSNPPTIRPRRLWR